MQDFDLFRFWGNIIIWPSYLGLLGCFFLTFQNIEKELNFLFFPNPAKLSFQTSLNEKKI